jgi:hypothetical protein
MTDAETPAPLIRHLPVGIVEAWIPVEHAAGQDFVAAPCDVRLPGRAENPDAEIAG